MVNGVQQGAIYAIIAVGYTMVYGVLRMINFAHGEVYMLGAFVAHLCVINGLYGLGSDNPPAWGIAAMVLTCMAACMTIGILIERLAYRPVRNAPRLIALITAIGMSFLLQNLALLWFQASPKYASVESVSRGLSLGGISISLGQLILLVSSLGMMFVLRILVMKTNFGRGMRAVSEDMGAASLMGVNVDKVILGTFAIGAALAGAGGAMTAAFVASPITPYFGFMPGLKAFVSAVLGGIGNIPGAVLGGLLLGVIEAFVAGNPTLSPYRDAVAFAVLILVLMVRPAGLLGRATAEKV